MRDESLVLLPSSAPAPAAVVLSRRAGFRVLEGAPSQRLLLASPDGAWLAYDSPDATLRVRAADGREAMVADFRGGDVRFAPDASALAVVTGQGRDSRVVRLELPSLRATNLGLVAHASWLEWTAAGLVVLHLADDGRTHQVRLLGPGGSSRLLHADAGLVDRFTAAAQGTRVVVFRRAGDGLDVLALDTEAPLAPPRRLAHLTGGVVNTELSPDGRRLAWIGAGGLWLLDVPPGDRSPVAGGPVQRDPTAGIHSLWWRADGTLVWAHPHGVHAEGAAGAFALQVADGDVRTVRLGRGGDRALLVVRAGTVERWDPEARAAGEAGEATIGQLEVLARADPGHAVQYADRFAGGIVVAQAVDRWLDEPEYDRPLEVPPRPQRSKR